ncbi:MAG: hypothetical protein MUO80_01430 [Dehalococcoidia bacterium]|nr:hypothetical protein [Dehalococcoidia bacterium]
MRTRVIPIYSVLVVVITLLAAFVPSCGGGEGEGEEMATFIADFMTPEGEPYPFDRVIVSNGTWRKEFNNVTAIDTEVPLNATYHFSYGWNTEEGVYHKDLRTILDFEPGETAEFEVFARDPDSINEVTQYVVGYREKGTNETIDNHWDNMTMTLTVSISAEPGKTFGMYGITNKQHAWPCAPNASTTAVTPFAPTWWKAVLEFIGIGIRIDTCKCDSYYENGNAKDDCSHTEVEIGGNGSGSIAVKFNTTDVSERSGLGVYGAFYRDAWITDVDISLSSIGGGNTTEPQYYYPQYAVLPGDYLLRVSSPPEYADFDLPVLLPPCRIEIAKIYLPKVDELEAFSFSVLAEEPGAKSSYSNLIHNATAETITVDVDTRFADDYWGCFVLPSIVTVAGVDSWGVGGWHNLTESYDYTINPAANYTLACIRIEPEYERIRVRY